MKITIIIPARYASTRFPGKPLAKITGKEMLLRVWELAQTVVNKNSGVEAIVATDDSRIVDFCNVNNINYVLTSQNCETGTDRVSEAITKLNYTPNFVINMQGDNPMCPPWFVEAMINAYKADQTIEMVTPVVNLTWQALDTLRNNKKTTPFSGTCAVFDKNHDAMYFSKNIIPSIRGEEKLRGEGGKLQKSPVYRQIGLYGYRTDILKKLPTIAVGYFEEFESLEQLRLMESGVKIRCVEVDYGAKEGVSSMSGIDSPEDLARAEQLFIKYGEF